MFLVIGPIYANCSEQIKPVLDIGSMAKDDQAEADAILNQLLGQSPDEMIKHREAEEPAYYFEASVNIDAGYEHNVFSNPIQEENSPFITTGISFFGFPTLDKNSIWDIYGFLENRHYFSLGSENDDEYMVMAAGQWKNNLSSGLGLGIDTAYSYYYEYMDLSLYELDQTSYLIEEHTASLAPFLEKNLKNGLSAKLSMGASTTWYADSTDDYDTFSLKTDFTKKISREKKFTLSYSCALNDYDDKEEKNIQGDALAGTDLETLLHGLKFRYQYKPDKHSPWRFWTLLKSSLKKDSGQAYYDYTLIGGEQFICYEQDSWKIETKAGISYYDYHERDIMGSDDYTDRSDSPGNDIETTDRTLFSFSCRAEKNIAKSWVLYLQGEYVINQSNEIININNDTYDYNSGSISLGLVWKYFTIDY